jgi:translation initiation factor 2D
MFRKENSSVYFEGKKGKDVPLRKSDRLRLRQQAMELLCRSPPDTCSENADSEVVAFCLEQDAVLDAAFLQGALSSRKLILDDGRKVTMYLRSPEDGQNTSTDEISFRWPYREPSPAQCVWLEIDFGPRNTLQVPSVVLLSVLPSSSLPTIPVPHQVSKYLCRGADLMRAGIFQLPLSWPSSQRVVAITVAGNPQPLAVGWLDNAVKSLQDVGPQTQGIGVHVVSCYGDDLWKQQLPPKQLRHNLNREARVNPTGGATFNAGHYGNLGFQEGVRVVPLSSSAESHPDAEGEEKHHGTASSKSTREKTNPPFPDEEETPPVLYGGENCAGMENITVSDDTYGSSKSNTLLDRDMENGEQKMSLEATNEALLHHAVCKAVAALSKSDLPMAVATFYAQYVLPSRPQGTIINLKQTRYKKFGVYVQEQIEQGLISVGPDVANKDPFAMLIDVNRRHPDVQHIVREEKANSPENGSSRLSGPNKLVLIDLYTVPHHFISPLRLNSEAVTAANATSEERKNSSMLTLKEIRALLDDYLIRENLARHNTVHLDGPLTDVLYKRKRTSGDPVQSTPQVLTRKQVALAWQDKMERGFALVKMPGNRIVKLGRGPPPQISIEVEQRQSKKFVTRIRGLESYNIDGRVFCKDVCQRFACAGSVDSDAPAGRATLKKNEVELILQGNLVDALDALLTGEENVTSHGGAKASPYAIPANAISVTLRKGVPARKRRPVPAKK